MEPDQWFDAGDRIAISGYAPRVTTVKPGEDSECSKNRNGSGLEFRGPVFSKKGDVFTITDVDTGKNLKHR